VACWILHQLSDVLKYPCRGFVARWQKPTTAGGSRRLMTREIKEAQYQVGKGSTQFKENPEYYFSPTLVLDPLG